MLAKPPVAAIASPTEGATVPVIVGSNRNEMMLFAMYSPLFVPWNLTADDRPAVLRQKLAGLTQAYKRSTAVPDVQAVLSDSDFATVLALYPVAECTCVTKKNYVLGTAQSQYGHSTVTAQSQYSHSTVRVRSQHSHIIQSPHSSQHSSQHTVSMVTS